MWPRQMLKSTAAAVPPVLAVGPLCLLSVLTGLIPRTDRLTDIRTTEPDHEEIVKEKSGRI